MKNVLLVIGVLILSSTSWGAPRPNAAALAKEGGNYHEVILSTCYKIGDLDMRTAALENNLTQCSDKTGQYFVRARFPYLVFEDVLILITDATKSDFVFEKQVTRQREVSEIFVSNLIPAVDFKGATDVADMQKVIYGKWEAFFSTHQLQLCK